MDTKEDPRKQFTTKNPNITVGVRVRPLSDAEASKNKSTLVKVADEHVIVFDPIDLNVKQLRGVPNHSTRNRDLSFAFDRVFDQNATSQQVFENTMKQLIDEVIQGYNCTCFAYGATGAGKTYTMIGDSSAPGVMVLTMEELFRSLEMLQQERIFNISISYLEVYNETIRDLLVESSPKLKMHDGEGKDVIVVGLSTHTPQSAKEVLSLLQKGNLRRSQSPTDANAQSSRSHAVFQVTVQQKERTANITTMIRTAKLSLIDLAGSERAAHMKNSGARLVEGANINKSLLALGNCINALGQGFQTGKYVPYRDSKLTRLLKDSLGGNCKTVMIANVSPSVFSYEDTKNTLDYANRAKNIKTHARPNELNLKHHMSQYREIVDNLRQEISELKALCGMQDVTATAPETEKEKAELARYKREVKVLVNERVTIVESIDLFLGEESVHMTLIAEKEAQIAESEKYPGSRVQMRQLHEELETLLHKVQEQDVNKSEFLGKLNRNMQASKQLQDEVENSLSLSVGKTLLQLALALHETQLSRASSALHLGEAHAQLAMEKAANRILRAAVKDRDDILTECNLMWKLEKVKKQENNTEEIHDRHVREKKEQREAKFRKPYDYDEPRAPFEGPEPNYTAGGVSNGSSDGGSMGGGGLEFRDRNDENVKPMPGVRIRFCSPQEFSHANTKEPPPKNATAKGILRPTVSTQSTQTIPLPTNQSTPNIQSTPSIPSKPIQSLSLLASRQKRPFRQSIAVANPATYNNNNNNNNHPVPLLSKTNKIPTIPAPIIKTPIQAGTNRRFNGGAQRVLKMSQVPPHPTLKSGQPTRSHTRSRSIHGLEPPKLRNLERSSSHSAIPRRRASHGVPARDDIVPPSSPPPAAFTKRTQSPPFKRRPRSPPGVWVKKVTPEGGGNNMTTSMSTLDDLILGSSCKVPRVIPEYPKWKVKD